MFELRSHIVADRPITDDDAGITLNLFNLCERYQTLPRAGGLLDQDALHVFIMENMTAWYDEKRRMEERRRGAQHP
jgi:hypothetical protein